LRNIYAKLNVRSRTEATMVAIQNGLVKLDLAPEQPNLADDFEAQPQAGTVETTISEPGTERRPPFAQWKRVYLVVAALAVAIGLWVTWPRRIEPESSPAGPPPDNGALVNIPGERWKRLADMPTPRSKLAAVYYNGLIYAIAGETAAGTSDVVQIYDPEQDRWTHGTSKTTPVASVGAAVLRGKIYVPGGSQQDGTMSDWLEVYEPDRGPSGTWQRAQNLPNALCAYALAVYEGELYLFGGWDGDTALATSYRYNARQDQWHELAPMPTRRAFAAAGTIGQHIYVVGGNDGQSDLSTCEVYAPNADDWQSCPDLQIPRSGAGAIVIDDKLHVVGGEKRQEDAVLKSEFLRPNDANPAQGEWQEFDSPYLQAWRYPGVAASDTVFYAVGGWGKGVLDEMRAYQVIYRVYLPVSSSGN
jgi:hypothetical protein